VIAVSGILLHDVGKVGIGDIEPLREQPSYQECHRRLVAQERAGILKFVKR